MDMTNRKKAAMTALGLALALSTGCATVKVNPSSAKPAANKIAKKPATNKDDPWKPFNQGVQKFNDTVDKSVLKPVAQGYDYIMPTYGHQGVTNFFNNMSDIGVFTNAALQGKFEQSGEDAGRFFVNTTLGVGGLLDVGTMIGLNKHEEDFDQTLAVWGVPSGPYLVLPFFGPSSPRAALGLIGDAALNPLTYSGYLLSTPASIGIGATKVVNTRANYLQAEKIANEGMLNRYEFFKNAYKDRRNYLINDGNVESEDILNLDEEVGAGALIQSR